jgi:hypothetical protein
VFEALPPSRLEKNTVSLADLLTIKRHINRLKDQESIMQLLAIQRIRNEQPHS